MDVNVKTKASVQIQAFYLFYIIVGIQVGVGIMGAPKFIFLEAEQDAWVSILLTFVFMSIIVLVMFAILKQYKNADIFGIQFDVFGKWIGTILGTIYILHFTASLLSIMLTYSEVVNIFLYNTFPNIALGLVLLSLTIYTVLGGFRVVVGAMFLFFFLSFWLIFLLYDPITRMEWTNLRPMFQASIPELLKGSRATTYTVSGFEILFLVYPFIQNKKNAKLPVFLGIAFTTLLILVTTVISIGYFSPNSLKNVDWSVLLLFKSVSLTFFERLDYIVIVEWVMVILPNLVILMWGVTYGIKRLYKVPQRVSLYVVSLFLLVIVSIVKYEHHITTFTDFVAKVSFWIVFVYPLLLLPLVWIKKKWRKRKGSAST
ncbi:spore germination protein (amino acid permease) [Oceanobacillus limi]|uniref:Spore germination protein (Amino acid permease) n=1 Tax=Oceanobacillus limi TaxID=930131 RepID=A0A1H9YH88_9BACI|nr:GerAB/ArcD/ProY family transporter [Oceanobacillus limi]SES68297.1 spore germination protein (amino acid permease) [Oceanobacillus limi]